MADTTIMTVRIDARLLAALKRRAKREGRSVSAEVVRLIRKDVEPAIAPPRRSRRTMGMFSDLDAPELAEFKHARQKASSRIRSKLEGQEK